MPCACAISLILKCRYVTGPALIPGAAQSTALPLSHPACNWNAAWRGRGALARVQARSGVRRPRRFPWSQVSRFTRNMQAHACVLAPTGPTTQAAPTFTNTSFYSLSIRRTLPTTEPIRYDVSCKRREKDKIKTDQKSTRRSSTQCGPKLASSRTVTRRTAMGT